MNFQEVRRVSHVSNIEDKLFDDGTGILLIWKTWKKSLFERSVLLEFEAQQFNHVKYSMLKYT